MAVLGPIKTFKGGDYEKEWPSLFCENLSVLQRGSEFHMMVGSWLQIAAFWIMDCRVPQAGLERAGWGSLAERL